MTVNKGLNHNYHKITVRFNILVLTLYPALPPAGRSHSMPCFHDVNSKNLTVLLLFFTTMRFHKYAIYHLQTFFLDNWASSTFKVTCGTFLIESHLGVKILYPCLAGKTQNNRFVQFINRRWIIIVLDEDAGLELVDTTSSCVSSLQLQFHTFTCCLFGGVSTFSSSVSEKLLWWCSGFGDRQTSCSGMCPGGCILYFHSWRHLHCGLDDDLSTIFSLFLNCLQEFERFCLPWSHRPTFLHSSLRIIVFLFSLLDLFCFFSLWPPSVALMPPWIYYSSCQTAVREREMTF